MTGHRTLSNSYLTSDYLDAIMSQTDSLKEKVMHVQAVEKEGNSNSRLLLAQQMSDEEFLVHEKSLKRKLDLRLTGMVWFIFVLNYLDRVIPTVSSVNTSN